MRPYLLRRLAAVTGCAFMAIATAPSAFATPSITSISPNNGPESGGTTVTIKGHEFIRGSTVKFGSTSVVGATVEPTQITATSPSGAGLQGISVSNANGTTAENPYDQFAYDPPPSGPWLGLNEQEAFAFLGTLGDFSSHDIVYTRELVTAGETPESEEHRHLRIALEEGHMPAMQVVVYPGYRAGCNVEDPNFPHTGGAYTIKQYAEAFVKTAQADLTLAEHIPGAKVFFEPINEPWCRTTPLHNGSEYAAVVAGVLAQAEKARNPSIPLSDIYVAGDHHEVPSNNHERWLTNMYANTEHPAELELPEGATVSSYIHTHIQGWYVHPYGRRTPAEVAEGKCEYAVKCLEILQKEMTSGQNNIVVSEVGFCALDVHNGETCPGPEEHTTAENSSQAAEWLTEALNDATPAHAAGWLRALLVYSRGVGGWAAELSGGVFTKQGEALIAFVKHPYAETKPVSNVSGAEAVLHGVVNPDGVGTEYYFEYGLTNTYGSKAPTPAGSAGAGTASLEEAAAIAGLSANATYHYRVVAASAGGVAYGADRTFSTSAPANLEPPTVTYATPAQGVAELTTAGAWTNSATNFNYQWMRCNAAGRECSPIPGATNSSYLPVQADVENTLAVSVTASNSAGSSSAESTASHRVESFGQLLEYPIAVGARAEAIAAGPDGNLWFGQVAVGSHVGKVGKVTPSGTVTEYELNSSASVAGIAPGPDENMWFTEHQTDRIGKIPTQGAITAPTEYRLPAGSGPEYITAGPDGRMWFTDYGSNKIGAITTGGTVSEYTLPAESHPMGITAGPDGNIWYADRGTGKIGRIKPNGNPVRLEYSLGSSSSAPRGICVGPDGSLWFTEESSNPKVGKITTSGAITEFSVPSGFMPHLITQGQDGSLWFTGNIETGKPFGRMTTAGVFSEVPQPPESHPDGIAQGPDGKLWFTEFYGGKIGSLAP